MYSIAEGSALLRPYRQVENGKSVRARACHLTAYLIRRHYVLGCRRISVAQAEILCPEPEKTLRREKVAHTKLD